MELVAQAPQLTQFRLQSFGLITTAKSRITRMLFQFSPFHSFMTLTLSKE
jgi:hypothetical protein